MTLDIGTIGPRPCEIALSSILSKLDDKKTTNKVISVLHDCKFGITQINYIPDKSFRTKMLINWKHYCIDRLAIRNIANIDAANHARCCIVAYCRMALHT